MNAQRFTSDRNEVDAAALGSDQRRNSWSRRTYRPQSDRLGKNHGG